MDARNGLTIFNQIFCMKAEYNAALQILMNDDLFLTNNDRHHVNEPVTLNLVEEAIQQVADVKTVTLNEFDFLGKNRKNFLILIDQSLQENHLKALESTLLRKQLLLDDVAILNYADYKNFNFEQLNAVFTAQKLVLFGLKPENLGLPEMVMNQVINNQNCQILYTYNFDEMLGNKEKTKAFWEPMKNL